MNMNGNNTVNNYLNNHKNNMNNNLIGNRIPFGNNTYNMCMNYCYPQIMVNAFYNNNGLNGIQMLNNRNNILQYC